MAIATYTVKPNWDPTVRFTATAETEIRITNPSTGDKTSLRWVPTDDDTVPTVDPAVAAEIRNGDKDSITLKSGERIWFAGNGAFSFSVIY